VYYARRKKAFPSESMLFNIFFSASNCPADNSLTLLVSAPRLHLNRRNKLY